MARLLTLYKIFNSLLIVSLIIMLLVSILYNQIVSNTTLSNISKTLECDINGKCEFNPN